MQCLALGGQGYLGPSRGCLGLSRGCLGLGRVIDLDGGLMQVSGEDVRGNRCSPRVYFSQLIRSLVVAPGDVVELEPVELVLQAPNLIVGAKAETPPFARGLRCSRWSDGDKTGRDTLRSIRHQTKACDVVVPPCGLVQLGGPRVFRPIVTGPAWPPRVTGLICKGIPVITVCNPALWEYSGDNLGS
jgi:hypothetical protein